MLAFLRKIRKTLLEAGATRRYMLYAIGEVLLVMVGILLALQVNNWNEWRKDRDYERKMLGEIDASLQLDILEMEKLLRLCQIIKEVSENGYKILESGHPDFDSLANLLGSSIQLDITFHYSAFESLKSKGLDNLLNDSLRVQLSALYDQAYKKVEQYLENYNQGLRIQWRPLLSETTRVELVDNQFANYLLDTVDVDKDHRISSMLKIKSFLLGRYSIYIQRTLQESQELSGLIRKELGE